MVGLFTGFTGPFTGITHLFTGFTGSFTEIGDLFTGNTPLALGLQGMGVYRK
jgi:hypothetical protein